MNFDAYERQLQHNAGVDDLPSDEPCCPFCHGSGFALWSVRIADYANAIGVVLKPVPELPGFVVECPRCELTGEPEFTFDEEMDWN